ncbi:MAG TPA: porin [Gemmatimonadaceae bacterium]|nr:porin [Gemmatimonadaceae bacterium]
MRSHNVRTLAIAMALSAATAGAQGLTPQNVEIHGFGSWNSGATNNSNLYLGAQNRGSSRNSVAGITLTGHMDEKLSFITQVKFDFSGTTQTALDYVFAQYDFRDYLKLRAGQVKQPFGLYTETIDIGTTRPFIEAPMAVYGPTANIAEAYRGVGLTGNVPVFMGMSLDYDIYGGGLNRDEYEPTLDAYRVLQGYRPWTGVSDGVGTELTDQTYGGRLMINLPITGMRIGSSGYHGNTNELPIPGRGNIRTIAHSFEYVANRVALRSEVLREIESDHDRQNGWYYEGAYRVAGGLQVAGLFDRASTHLKGKKRGCAAPCSDYPELGKSLLSHKETAAGLNYWFSPSFVMKLSYHHIEGNRFAQPNRDDLVAKLSAAYAIPGNTTSPLPNETDAMLLGAQFSF